jgi:hypothetical protein
MASAQVAAMTAQFFSGLGNDNQTFGPGTATSQDRRQQHQDRERHDQLDQS